VGDDTRLSLAWVWMEGPLTDLTAHPPTLTCDANHSSHHHNTHTGLVVPRAYLWQRGHNAADAERGAQVQVGGWKRGVRESIGFVVGVGAKWVCVRPYP